MTRNEFVFGPNCAICNKYKLKYKQNGESIVELPFPVSLKASEENIRKSLKAKMSEYEELYNKTIDLDLIAAEFKYHNKCRKNLTRPVKVYPKEGSNYREDFKRLTSYIDQHILDMNQVISMTSALEIYCDSNFDDADASVIRKRRSRLKNYIAQHYGI